MDFAKMAEMSREDLPEVKNLPIGAYIWSIDRVPEMSLSKNGSTQMINIRVKLVSPIDDFDGDEDELAAYGNPTGEIRTHTLFFPHEPREDEDNAAFERRCASAMKRISSFFFDHCGVEAETVKEAIEGSVNHQFIGIIIHEMNEQTGEMRDRIGRTMSAEE